MKSLSIAIVTILLYSTSLLAQLTVPAQNQNFHDWARQTNHYLDSVRVIVNNDSIFYEEGGEYAKFQRYYYTHLPLVAGHGSLEIYSQQINNYYATHPLNVGPTSRAAQANNDAWEELGPKTTTNYDFASSIGPTEAIAFSPLNSQHMLVASLEGGLFKSTDGGEHWANAGSDTKWQRIRCQYAQFSPTTANCWFACNAGNLSGTEFFYRTTNGGASYEVIGYHSPSSLEYYNTLYNFILPSYDGAIIFVASANGLFKTTNAMDVATNVAWTKLAIPIPTDVSTYMSSNGITPLVGEYKCYDVEFVGPQTSITTQDIVASITFYGTKASAKVGVTAYMQSADGGITWSILPNHPALNSTDVWYTIETSKKFPSYVFTQNSNQINRFDINTSTWKFVGNVTTTLGAGHGFGIDNVNGNVHFSNDIYYNKFEYNLVTDTYVKVFGSTKYTTHADNLDFICDPTTADVVWVANDGGVGKSETGGATWVDKSDGLGLAMMQQAAYSTEDGSSILAGLYHDGNVLTTTPYNPNNWNPNWKTVNWGDGNSALIDNKNSNYMYTAYNSSSLATTNKFVSKAGMQIIVPWDNTMVLDKNNTSTLFRGVFKVVGYTSGINPQPIYSQEIVRSFSRGVGTTNIYISDFYSWFQSAYPTVVKHHIWRIYTPSAESNAKYLLAHIICYEASGAIKHRLFRTKIFDDANPANVVASWEELPLPSQNWCGQITFDPTNPNILYIPYGSHNQNPNSITGTNMLFKVDYTNPSLLTYNFANDPNNTVNPALYLNLTRNLPNVAGGAFTIDKYSNGGMYYGTVVGVYYTNTKMLANNTNWVEFGAGLPNSGTKGLDINYATNKLRTPVWGRGMWQHDLYCPTDANLTEAGSYTANDYLEAQNKITSTAAVPNITQITYRAGTEIELADGFAAVEGAEFGAFTHSCNTPYTNSFRKAKPTQQYSTPEVYNPTNPTTLSIHPNPTNGIVYITGAESNLYYTLKSITSISLKQGRITNNQLSIAEYPAGMYLLQLTNANTDVSTTFKVVKE